MLYTCYYIPFYNGRVHFSVSLRDIDKCSSFIKEDKNLHFTLVGQKVYAYSYDGQPNRHANRTLGRTLEMIERQELIVRSFDGTLSPVDRKNLFQDLIGQYGQRGLEFIQSSSNDLFTRAFVDAVYECSCGNLDNIQIPTAESIFRIFKVLKKRHPHIRHHLDDVD